MSKKSKELEEIKEYFNEEDKINEEEIEKLEIDAKFIAGIEENMIYIEEERNLGYILHSVENIVLSVIFAILANCNTFVQIHLFMCKHYEWLNNHIKFENGLPSISTVKRVIAFINPKEMELVCKEATKSYLKTKSNIYEDKDITIQDIKAMDGKTANSSDRNSSKEGKVSKMNAMTVYSVKDDISEATEFINEKTNEIPTGPILLSQINIENSIVTFDAMSTQKNTIEYIVSQKGYYVAPVKGNQEILEENIKQYFGDKKLYKEAKAENYYIEKEHRGNSYDQREYIFTNDIDWMYEKKEWKGIKSIGIAKRTYTDKNGEKKEDKRYYISNIDARKVELLGKAIRKEWGVENKIHYYLDMVFKEDENSSFLKNTQKNLNIIRKFALGILKKNKEGTKLSLNSIRFNLSMDYENEIEKVIQKLYQ